MTAAKLQRICPYSSNQLNPLWTWESAVMTKNTRRQISLFLFICIYTLRCKGAFPAWSEYSGPKNIWLFADNKNKPKS